MEGVPGVTEGEVMGMYVVAGVAGLAGVMEGEVCGTNVEAAAMEGEV